MADFRDSISFSQGLVLGFALGIFLMAACAGCSNWEVERDPAGYEMTVKGCYLLHPISVELLGIEPCGHKWRLHYGAGEPQLYCGSDPRAQSKGSC